MSATTIALIVLSVLVGVLILVLVIVIQQYRIKVAQLKTAAPVPVLSTPDYAVLAETQLAPIVAKLTAIVQAAENQRTSLLTEIHRIEALPDPAKRVEGLSELYNRLRAEQPKATP